jgi:hypothetical protein|nr:hypothetical protein [uncultured Prevotella sp.]DAZ14049.1 MAG TPA: hypothetical protein [Caudoviricetes sp.]
MKKLVNTSKITAKTVEAVKAQVEEQLSYLGYVVVESESEAEEYLKDIEGDGYLYDDVEQTFSLDGEMNGEWQSTITVTIKSYYKDSGSIDYCYSVNVTED